MYNFDKLFDPDTYWEPVVLPGKQPAPVQPPPEPVEDEPIGPDGWPVNSVVPPAPCERCGGSDFWWDMLGGHHCARCDPPSPKADRWWQLSAKLRREARN
jgi:hypothetical protein